MKRLSYKTLKEQYYNRYLLQNAPEKVLQFGEGNFLRAFADYFIDILNEETDFNGKVVIVQPREKRTSVTIAEKLNEQEGLYTLYQRGFKDNQQINEKRIISCVSRCINAYSDFEAMIQCAENPDLRYIISNTTEAGIQYDPSCQFTDAPASSFPGKLTQFLYHRFEIWGKETGKGFIILPCELIDDNGKALKDCVIRYAHQWELGENFLQWLEEENIFCSTLVDRIVTGYPQNEAQTLHKENGYEDQVINACEIFAFWAIEGPDWIQKELNFKKAGLPVIITDDYVPYKHRKVRILNGAHTASVLGAYLAGKNIIRDCMEDDVIRTFMNKAILQEIIPTLTLPKIELEIFAHAVNERFQNPFIDHELLSIALNSTSKWKNRVLPTLKDYIKKTGSLPKYLTMSFAFYLEFYRRGKILTTDGLMASRPNGDQYIISDDPKILEFYRIHRNDSTSQFVSSVCSNREFWGEDLTNLPGFADKITELLESIDKTSVYDVIKENL